jgi:hypothetical protein
MNQNIQPTDARDVIQPLTQTFGKLPQVLAVVLGGSRAAATSDVASDLRSLRAHGVGSARRFSTDTFGGERGNRQSLLGTRRRVERSIHGTHIDIMYRSPAWIEGQIERILSRHEASLGYTTCFWYDIVTSARLRSKRCFGWRAFVSASCSAGGGQGGAKFRHRFLRSTSTNRPV